ncbi:ankyrin repeat-containing domain protein [Fusarium tricinctum]|uniref:Ankyrin repeat-containing domain protein n=1 Tax=Fusarium tricinctum TaxID=61284 RepID=A0A8K0RVA9_9HYPO|nr:ankyrin repeat-containing domain protein [Fusarium tricinctum]
MPKSVNTADEYDFVDHADTALSPETIAKLREWLQPTDYLAESGEYRRHLLSQAPGTGLWLCQTDEYRKWHDSPDHGSLWIKGVPGAGKSVMAASLIQHLRTTEDCPVLFFFFRNIVAANFAPRALIQDWLAQLLPFSPKLQFALQPRLKTNLAETSDNDLIQLFLDGISCVPKLYCVGDALDEMSTDNRPFLQKLNSLASHRPRSLKFLMTSRPKQHLQSTLRDSSIVHISLQQRLVDADILSYLNYRFDMAPNSDCHLELKQDIIDMVAKRSEGLFLYAKITMDQVDNSLQLDESINIANLEASLPLGLEQTYTSMLVKQRGEPGVTTDVQILVLEAVTHSSRPLRLNELASLLECVRPDISESNGFKRLISVSCGPLIEILEDETLQVIHHSFTEFLRGDTRNATALSESDFPIIDSLQAHKHMAVNCLRYLQSDPSVSFEKPRHLAEKHEMVDRRDYFEYRQARLQHPFLSYAVENWSYHASFYDVEDSGFFQAITEFLNPESLSFRRWLVIQWGSTSRSRETSEGIPTSLHLAAFAGLSELALRLLQGGASASATDAQERTPLHWAAANGHERLVTLLIERGTDPDGADGRGVKPMHLAALKNHTGVVTRLLKAGVKPDTLKTKNDYAGHIPSGAILTKGQCALMYVSRAGHTETLMAMIPYCDPQMLEQLLCQSCLYGRIDNVLALLKYSSVSANAMFEGATALFIACHMTGLKCADALLRAGADSQKTSKWKPRTIICGQSFRERYESAPIHWLVGSWTEENDSDSKAILELLITAGADIDQPNGEGRTALINAAGYTSYNSGKGGICKPSVKALIKAGANFKAIDEDGNSVLHQVTSQCKDLEVVKLLVERGCDPNAKNDLGETALICAVNKPTRRCTDSDEATLRIVEYLLDHGADPSLKTTNGDTALLLSMQLGVDIFKLLLSICDDMDERRRCWFNLSKVRAHMFETLLEILLAEGIDMETRGENGNTLYLDCLRGSRDLSRVLRDHGAQNNVKDANGNNPILAACLTDIRDFGILKTFWAEGVDPLDTNNNGDNVLHLVAGWYTGEKKHASIVRWLVDLGLPVNATNSQGNTPLHVFQKQNNGRGNDSGSHDHTHFFDAINSRGEVDLQHRDTDSLSALHLAALRSEVDVVKLISLGADPNYLTSDSQNPLHIACRARQANIVGGLLELCKNINIDQQDAFGRTPLHYACSSGEPESVAWLLEYGASTLLKASDGSTVLHACADNGTEQCMWNVRGRRAGWLRSPADPLRPGNFADGRRPWYKAKYKPAEVAIRRQFSPVITTIIYMLVGAGVSVAEEDKHSRTALDNALFTGCAPFAEVFSRDDKLFKTATSLLRKRIKMQMYLMRPRSILDTLREDEAGFKDLLEKPDTYLGLLSVEDTAELMKETLEADPSSEATYNLVSRLMQPSFCQVIDSLAIVKKAPAVIRSYSDYHSVKEMFRKRRLNEFCFDEAPTMTALGIACSQEHSNMLTLKTLIEELQVDPNARFATARDGIENPEVVSGGSALHVLASADHYWQVEGLRYLLDKGADVNILDENKQTPLHVAAKGFQHRYHDVEGLWRLLAVQALLDHGADMNILDQESLCALHKASTAPVITRELLSRGADAKAGAYSPLFSAIFDQNLETLNILLDHGLSADQIAQTRHSRDVNPLLQRSRLVCPLLCASCVEQANRHIEDTLPLFTTLIERGVNLYLPLNDDETLIHFLFEWSEHAVIDALLQEPCVSRVDFSHREKQGRTILMAACDWRGTLPSYSTRARRPQIPQTGSPLRILDLGVDATVVDDAGRTALHHLMDNPGCPDEVLLEFMNREEVASTLFQQDSNGYTPFHCALGNLRPAICEAFLVKGVNLLEPDPQGRTVLHYIASQCLLKNRNLGDSSRTYRELGGEYFEKCVVIWRKFLAQGGSINAPDHDGNTPLHAYFSMLDPKSWKEKAETCHMDHYDTLFPKESDVDVFVANNVGETVLHTIASRAHSDCTVKGHDKELFVMMMNKGLDPLREDDKGRSALDIASACDKDDTVGLFGRK